MKDDKMHMRFIHSSTMNTISIIGLRQTTYLNSSPNQNCLYWEARLSVQLSAQQDHLSPHTFIYYLNFSNWTHTTFIVRKQILISLNPYQRTPNKCYVKFIIAPITKIVDKGTDHHCITQHLLPKISCVFQNIALERARFFFGKIIVWH